DIKPHNIVVGPDGRLKVTDFGIARSGTSQMTEAGSIIGTAQYLSPEQARGTMVDQRSDLYSVGIVLYEMLTGSVPFTGDTPRARRAAAAAPGARPPSGYYEYAEPGRRRPFWPWLLALLLVVGAGFAAFYVYTKIQDQLNATKPATVPFVVGDKEVLAVGNI